MEDRVDNSDLPVTGDRATLSCGSQEKREATLQGLPAPAREKFPWLEAATDRDLAVIRRQLGRPPRGQMFVARRCSLGNPSVLLTLPHPGEGGPVPPPLWLSCPYLVREVSRMESEGTIRRYSEALDRKGFDDREKKLFIEEEKRFGRLQAILSVGCSETQAGRLARRGIAGGRPGAVKCLHAHTAYRLASGQGVVGGWCLQELENGKGLICEKIPEACLT
jgi:uncharacterized protein